MAQNPEIPLSPDDARHTWALAKSIREHAGRVHVFYEKRNGERKRYEGGFDRFVGKVGTDKFSANIVTDDGVKSLNLCRVITLTLIEKE